VRGEVGWTGLLPMSLSRDLKNSFVTAVDLSIAAAAASFGSEVGPLISRANTSEALLAKGGPTRSASAVSIRVMPNGVRADVRGPAPETQAAREKTGRGWLEENAER
jgi:hypothetical protein